MSVKIIEFHCVMQINVLSIYLYVPAAEEANMAQKTIANLMTFLPATRQLVGNNWTKAKYHTMLL